MLNFGLQKPQKNNQFWKIDKNCKMLIKNLNGVHL